MRYLIPEFCGLGDFIQKTPMIRSIKENDPEASVIVIGDNRWSALEAISESRLIDEACNALDFLGITLPNYYTNRELDLMYDGLSTSQREKMLSWLTKTEWDVYIETIGGGAPEFMTRMVEQFKNRRVIRHVDFDDFSKMKWLQWFKYQRRSKKNVTCIPLLRGRHNIDSNYDLLEAVRQTPIERNSKTWISSSTDVAVLEEWGLKEKGYICLQPGAAGGAPTPKTWHPKNFVDLSCRLMRDQNYTIVLIGDTGDHHNIVSQHEWPTGVINTAGKTSIRGLVSLLENALCVVVHDSGIMHLANALNVPLVALYGPTNYARTRPLGEQSTILYSRTKSFAIMYRSKKSERKLADEYPEHIAMSGISVNDVEKAVMQFIT